MAYFQRLMCFLCLCLPVFGFAQTSGYKAVLSYLGVQKEAVAQTPSQAVSSVIALFNLNSLIVYCTHGSTYYYQYQSVDVNVPNMSFHLNFVAPSGMSGICINNATGGPTRDLAGVLSPYVCQAGSVFENGVCGPPACPPLGTVEGSKDNAVESVGSFPPKSVCIFGCEWKGGGAIPAGCMNGKCYTYGPFTSTGASCTGEGSSAPDAEEPDPDDAQCVRKGLCPGEVNGTKVCVPCGSKSGSEETTQETTETDGQGNETNTTTTTKKTVECSGGACTVTTRTDKTVDGVTTSEEVVSTEPQQSYCTNNPTASVCKGEEEDQSSWGGACSGGFQCDGDAVQCAQAQAAWQIKCALDVDPQNATVQAGLSSMTAGDTPVGHPRANVDQVTLQLSSMLDSSPLFGSSADCPVDVSVTVMGNSVSLPFSSMCPYLRMLGAGFMAAAYLAAAFIVFRG